MHPIEHMRYLARTTGEDPGVIAAEYYPSGGLLIATPTN